MLVNVILWNNQSNSHSSFISNEGKDKNA